jgi:hypothetical protein
MTRAVVRGGLFIALLLVWPVMPVFAQDAGLVPDQSAPRAPGILSKYNFHLSAMRLGIEDPRFTWDADFGGNVDLIDYGFGRLNFLANYEAILGEEIRAFDVNQSSYTLDFRASVRAPRQEVAAVFNHVSRHLSDRFRPVPVDWNMVGAQYWRRDAVGTAEVRSTGMAVFNVTRSFVDYEAQIGGKVSLDAPVASRVDVIASGAFTLVPVDDAVRGRDTQWGTRLEGGIRIGGDAAVAELVLGYERRLDAHPFESLPLDWMFLGFRFVSR